MQWWAARRRFLSGGACRGMHVERRMCACGWVGWHVRTASPYVCVTYLHVHMRYFAHLDELNDATSGDEGGMCKACVCVEHACMCMCRPR